MKVKMHIEVEVDPRNWNAALGDNMGDVHVAKDVVVYVMYAVQNLAVIEESDATVRLTHVVSRALSAGDRDRLVDPAYAGAGATTGTGEG